MVNGSFVHFCLFLSGLGVDIFPPAPAVDNHPDPEIGAGITIGAQPGQRHVHRPHPGVRL